MSILKFTPHNHKYTSENEEINWLSVTSLISNFKKPFDVDRIAKKCSTNKKSKWYGLTSEEIKEAWKAEANRATTLGTWYHNQREADICEIESMERHGTTVPIFKPIEKDGVKYSPEQKLKDGIYPEHMVYLRSAGICGQSDLVEVVDGKVHITDYKGLALDTVIPTPEGYKLMQDIQVGDKIFDGNGKITTVENVSEIHYNPCFKFVFDTNDELVADHEHKWVVTERRVKGRAHVLSYVDVEKTTEELYHDLLAGKKLRIKCINDLELQEKKLPIDSYVFGAWLGDGAKSCGMITNMNNEVWNEIEKRGYTLGNDVSQGGAGQAVSRTVLGIYSILKEINVLNDKHIPDIYMTASRSQRLDLLRGFMDTDGHYNKTRNRCVMVTTQKWQADALSALVASLGWKPTIIVTKTKCTNCDNAKDVTAYHVGFKVIGENPFLIRNQDIVSKECVQSNYRYIKRIEKVETVPTKCLAVDSPDHTYLAGKTYIKTHNTNKEIKIEGYTNWEGITQKMAPPVSHLDDCHFNHYALQLSMYMYIILKHNPKLTAGTLTIHHILFEEAGRDRFDNPISAVDSHGDPIITDIVQYDLPYLKEETIKIIYWLENNRQNIKLH